MALCAIWLSPDWIDAGRWFTRALEIQPDFAPAHTHFAAFLSVRNRFPEAHAHILQAVALEPLSPAVHGTGALCMFTAGQYPEALGFGRRALELHSDFAVGLYALGLTYCRTGQFDEACDAFERLLPWSNRATYFVGWGALAHALADAQLTHRRWRLMSRENIRVSTSTRSHQCCLVYQWVISRHRGRAACVYREGWARLSGRTHRSVSWLLGQGRTLQRSPVPLASRTKLHRCEFA